MKSQEFYSIINQIDDDLIESAKVIKPSNKVIPFRKYSVIVACLCLIVMGVLIVNNSTGTEIYINEISSIIMKSVDVDTIPYDISQEEIEDYFDKFILPDKLLSKFMLDKQSKYTFLVNDRNMICDDTTVFNYRYEEQIVEVQLSKIGCQYGEIFRDSMDKKKSRIGNQNIMIGKYVDYIIKEEVIEIQKYVAEYKDGNIYIHIECEGLYAEEFIELLTKLIHLNSDK